MKFINCTSSSLGILEAYAHGAYLTLIDGIGLGTGLSPKEAQNIKIACHNALLAQLPDEKTRLAADDASGFKPQDHGVLAPSCLGFVWDVCWSTCNINYANGQVLTLVACRPSIGWEPCLGIPTVSQHTFTTGALGHRSVLHTMWAK